MNGEILYQQLKSGQINKSQLTNQEIGEVYKYMVDSKRVSVKEIKPEVAKNLGLSSNQYKPKVTERKEVPKVEVPKNEPIEEKTSWFDNFKSSFKAPTMNAYQTRDMRYQPTQKQSANPENELADLLSNLSMGGNTQRDLDRGKMIIHERSSLARPMPKNDNPNLVDRVGYGLSAIGQNWLGGILGTSGTGSEFLGTGDEITLGNGKTDKGFDLSYQLQPSAKEMMNTSDELLQQAQANTQLGKQGLGRVGSTVYDILQGAGQMGADIGTAAVTGLGVMPVIGARSFGQGASQARQEGADLGQQVAYGALSAGIEMATEKLVGGLPMAKKLGMGGVADNTIQRTATKLAQGISSSPRLAKGLTYLANMAGEGAEEMIAEILSPVAQRMIYDPNADWATMEEILYSGLLGAGISGIMGGGVMFQGETQEQSKPLENSEQLTNDVPNLQGFQETIDTGLNQLYSVLDTQPNEQAIDKMITNLEQVRQNVPTLSSYVDNHIERLNSYKPQPIIEPTTNENTEVEQTFNEDITNAESTIKDVSEDIAEIGTQIDNNVVETQTEKVQQPIEEISTVEPVIENKVEKQPTETTNDTEGNVLTKEQQEVFKDSKVKDKDGNLLVVYHGTDAKFDTFKPNYAPGWGTGIYLTDNVENAKDYGKNIIKAYVDMKKPYYDTDNKVDISNTKAYKKYEDKIIKERAEDQNMTVEEYLEEEGRPDWELEWDRLYDADGDITVISKALQELGYDGFIGKDSNNINGLEIVAFNPEQIQRIDNQETPLQANTEPTTNETEISEQIVEEETKVVEKADTEEVVTETKQVEETEEVKEEQIEEAKTKGYTGEQGFIGGKTNSSVIDMSRPLKKPSEIKKFITRSFKIPMSSKRFNKRKYLGYYKVLPETIRLKFNNDLGVVMHELGHHLDKKYNFSDNELIKKMISKLNPNFAKAYKKSELPGEAIAEFLRYYTTDTNTALEFAEDFYNVFESTLDKTDLKNIQTIRSDTLRWVNATQDEKALKTIVAVNKDKDSVKDKARAEEIEMVLFDDLISLDRFSKTVESTTGKKLNPKDNPYFLALMTRKNGAIIDSILAGETIDTEFNVINKDNLDKIVEDVGKDLEMFELYLKRKHALTLQDKGHKVFPDEIVLTQDTIAAMDKQYPKFKELSERLYKWYDTFFKAWVIDTNLLGKDTKKIYETMRQEYPFYVPMFRSKQSLTGDKSVKTAKNEFSNQKSPVDRLSEKGSDADTISPLDGLIMQVNRIVNAQTKNNVMRTIVKQYGKVDGLGMFLDKVSPDMEKQIIETQGLKNKLEKDFEGVLEPDDLESILESIPDMLTSFKPLSYSKDNDIITMIAEDGSKQFYEVFDVNLFKSLTNMDRKQLDFTVKMLSSIRRHMTALTTGTNPIFGLASNFPRDIQQAYVYGSYKNPLEYGYQTIKSLFEVAKKTDNYKQFMATGGGYAASMFGADRKMIDSVSKQLDKRRKGKFNPKNSLDHLVEFIESFNDLIETAPRLTEYNKALKIAKNKGMNEYDSKLYALQKSNDVTLNFLKHGTILNTAVGQTIPYLNAGLQGIDKLKRSFITDTETRKATWSKTIVSLTLPTILLWLAHRDDEDYEKLSRGIKDNYWILWKNDDGSFVRLPKPKDLAGLFGADFERGLDAFFKEQGEEAFNGFLATLSNSLLPPMDTIFRPMLDVGKNEKWSGGKIVSTSLSNLTKQNQYDETTSRISVNLSKAIAKVFPNSTLASPKNLDYIIDQYWGGLADIILPMTTPNSYTTAEFIKRKFIADPSYSNDIIDKYYEIRDKTQKANNSYEKVGDFTKDVDFAAEKHLEGYYKAISAYWKQINYVGELEDITLEDFQVEIFKELINASRFADNSKQSVIDDLKDKKLEKKNVILLQKTIRDEIVNLAEKAVKEFNEYHEESNKYYKEISKQGQ